MRRTPFAAVPLMIGALLLAGCGGDEEPSADPTTASPTMSESPDTPTSDAPSEDAVEPATGELVESQQFSFHLPKGWKQQKEVLGSTFSYDPDNTDAIELTVVDASSRSMTLDEAAKSALRVQVRDKLKRVEDAELGGIPAFHLYSPGELERAYDEYGLWLGDQFISIGFEIRGDDQFRREIIDSVLASWTWK